MTTSSPMRMRRYPAYAAHRSVVELSIEEPRWIVRSLSPSHSGYSRLLPSLLAAFLSFDQLNSPPLSPFLSPRIAVVRLSSPQSFAGSA